MTNSLTSGKTFEEIINQPHELVMSMWLSSNDSSNLSIEQIVQIIDKFSSEQYSKENFDKDSKLRNKVQRVFESLITFHINNFLKLDAKGSSQVIFEKLIRFYNSHLNFFSSTINLYNQRTLEEIIRFEISEKLILDKEGYKALINAQFKFIDNAYIAALTINYYNSHIKKHLNTEEENFEFDNIDLTRFYQNWKLTHLFKSKISNNHDIFTFLQIFTNIKYEILDDYLIAYKGVSEDNESVMSPICKYEVGKEYEEVSDNNFENENSFGLSVWDKEHALNYGKTILTCKVYLKDITYFDLCDGKLRCSKFKIIDSNTYN